MAGDLDLRFLIYNDVQGWMPVTDAGPYWGNSNLPQGPKTWGSVQQPEVTVTTGALMNEVNALTRERDQWKHDAELAMESDHNNSQRVDELRAELGRCQVELTHRVGWEERCLRAEAEVERLRVQVEETAKECGIQKTENERLRAALKRFGKHALSCVMRPGDGCICGLDDVLGEKTLPDESY